MCQNFQTRNPDLVAVLLLSTEVERPNTNITPMWWHLVNARRTQSHCLWHPVTKTIGTEHRIVGHTYSVEHKRHDKCTIRTAAVEYETPDHSIIQATVVSNTKPAAMTKRQHVDLLVPRAEGSNEAHAPPTSTTPSRSATATTRLNKSNLILQ